MTTYADIKGANTLLNFLLDPLSEETKYRMLKEYKAAGLLIEQDEVEQDFEDHIHSALCDIVYTAAFNLAQNTIDEDKEPDRFLSMIQD